MFTLLNGSDYSHEHRTTGISITLFGFKLDEKKYSTRLIYVGGSVAQKSRRNE